METINNMAQAAAKAVWGEGASGSEPVSGQQGDTSRGEPFDKGNAEEPNSSINTSTAAPTTAGPTSTTGPSTTDQSSDVNRGASTTDESSNINKGAEFAKSTGTAAESDKVPQNEQTELKAKDTPADTSKGQNDTRDPSNPQTNPKNNPTDVDDTSEGINKGQELDGPGPKPLIEVAKEHGGDAGNAATPADASSSDKKADSAPESDDPNDPRAPSKGEGTGEKYVKSTGLHADGGDFDAANPGAGREADRLLEEKGIHLNHGDGPSAPGEHQTSSGGGDAAEKEKKSLKDKIKDKLHRH